MSQVALTGRNTTGPPFTVAVELSLDCMAAWRHRLACAREAACSVTYDADGGRQTPESKTILPPTLCV